MASAKPRLGVAYYPEQWPRERWERDASLMAEAGLSTVRVAEFAWSKLEPRAGVFELSWLDDVVGILADAGLEVVLGTPTAAPPAWVVDAVPGVLPVRGDGRTHPFGHRRHYCPSNERFREVAAPVVRVLSERYGGDERVVAWQIDNEFGGRCYCDGCRRAFQRWLERRYGTIDALNDAWGTDFWSQTYDAWSQIPLPEAGPVPLPDGFLWSSPAPALGLDFRRFVSDCYLGFLRQQTGWLRDGGALQPVTHNLMGFGFGEIDYHSLAAELDIVSWDNYPSLGGRPQHWTGAALSADATRGLAERPVWVMEQQAGPVGWEVVRTPRRGQVRLFAFQAIAHGAELVSFFRWRTARFGTEQHWDGVLGVDGRPNRRLRELTTLAREVSGLREALAGATPRADAAVLHDYDSRFALQVQPTNAALAYEPTVHAHYAALRSLGVDCDVVGPAAGLDRYRLLVAPNLYVLDEQVAGLLRTYVEAGGTLVLAPRCGVKDRRNAVPERPLPAWLDTLAGVEVVELASFADDRSVRIAGVDGFAGGSFHGWFEELELTDAEALAVYAEGDFAAAAAISSRSVGAGRVVYVGGVGDASTLTGLYRSLVPAAGVASMELPDGVEVVRLHRPDRAHPLLFVLNHADDERILELDVACRDRIGGADHVGRLRLAPFDVALLEPVRATSVHPAPVG